MKTKLMILFLPICTWANFQTQIGLVRSHISVPNEHIMSFDGERFALKDEDMRKALTRNGITADINTRAKEPYLHLKKPDFQYKLSWKKQEFENGPGLRLNQVTYDKTAKSFELNSTTYDGDYLRSATQCFGHHSSQMGVLGKKTTYCATATRHVCDKVIEVYRGNERLNSKDTIPGDRRKVQKEQLNSCLNVMAGFSEVLSGFGKKIEDNAAIHNSREAIIEQENKVVGQMLDQIDTGDMASRVHINSLKNREDFEKAASDLTSTMMGMHQVQSFIDLCLDHKSEFRSKDEPTARTAPKQGTATR